MHTGGAEYNQEAARAIQIIGLALSPVVAIYAILIILGILPSVHYTNPLVAGTIVFMWVAAMAFYYFFPPKDRTEQAVKLIIFHILSLLIFVSIAGFANPFTPLYVVLFIASYVFFSKRGLIYSTLALLFAITVDTLALYQIDPIILLNNVVSILVTLLVGYAAVGVMSAQETKRQTLLHSQARERLQYDRIMTIMNNLTDAAFSTDEKGGIQLYNAACLDLLDTNESLKGRNISDLFNLTTSDGKKTSLERILKEATRAVRRDDLNHTYADGESIRLEINFAPIRSSFSVSKLKDEQGGYILIMRDVTKQKSLEEERDEFISVVSHELRTPITIVEGTLSNLEVMTSKSKAPSKAALNGAIDIAHEQTLYLSKMVNDLSTLSRAERGVADAPEAIDVAALLQDMHQRYEKDAEAQKLHLNLDLGTKLGTVTVSRLYLEELLQNFITNAIKYTHKGSITIIAKRKKDMVTFTVKDTGIGISRSDQNKVFNKFYRSEDYRIRETNGTGLGLYVSAKLAHKLHTTINLESRLNHGSSFSFELPVE